MKVNCEVRMQIDHAHRDIQRMMAKFWFTWEQFLCDNHCGENSENL